MNEQEAKQELVMAQDRLYLMSHMDDNRIKAFRMAYEALEEIQQYRALGTVEELREAKEKQIAKKVIKWADGTEHCPCCDLDNSAIGYGVCIDCGQKLEWGE